MLLWHDSLDYPAGSTMLGQSYTISTGMLSGQAHPQSGRLGVATSAGVLRPPLPVPTGFDSEKVSLGFLLKVETVSTPVDGSTFLEIRDSGGVAKMKILLRTEAAGFSFQLQASNESPLIFRTEVLPYNQFLFIEFQIRFSSSQGSAIFRVNGVESSRKENLITDLNPISGWTDVVFLLAAAPATFRLADLYICDGTGSAKTFTTFLGRIDSRKVHLASDRVKEFSWGPAPAPGKYRLVLMFGHSNVMGYGVPLQAHMPWLNPNPAVPIWNIQAQAFQPLEAGVNSACYYFGSEPTFGMEMEFASQIASLYAQAGSSTSNVRIVKMAVPGSYTYLGDPGYSWNIGIVGGLYPRLQTEIAAAVAALGGMGNIERVDIFGYLGEIETLQEASVGDPYPGPYYTDYANILGSLILFTFPGIPISVSITKIHLKTFEFFPGMVEKIRFRQDLLARSLGFEGINIDKLPLFDTVHLDNRGLDMYGDAVFERWRSVQNYSLGLMDQTTLLSPPDANWLGSNTPGASVGFDQAKAKQIGLVNSAVLASSCLFHRAVTAPGGSLKASLGDVPLLTAALPQVPAWALTRLVSQKVLSPEQACGKVALQWL